MKLPTLYKKTTTGAQQEWSVWTEGNVICTRWGQTDGKMQEGRDVITTGKNLGRSNETTPEGQAEFEAKALWEKKKKKRGYHEDANAAMEGKDNDLIEGGIFPMLAHRFDKHGHKIKWPAFSQPKLDGHRCIAVVRNGKASLWTRTRKPIPCLPHITQFLEGTIDGNAVFDGELYNHELKDHFEELTSHVRQQKEPKEGHEIVQLHVYDFPHDAGFKDRNETLQDFFDSINRKISPVKQVDTVAVGDEVDLMHTFESFLERGYEGAMVRNAEGGYTNARSYDLMKVKEFDDGEFVVVGVEEGRGKLAGHAIFVLQTEGGTNFNAKMAGELKELKRFLANPELAIGRFVTVQYQGLTGAKKVPRFPVVLGFKAL